MARVDHRGLSRRVRLAEIVLALIVVVGGAVVARLIVAGPLFADTIQVTVDLPGAAGLHKRSDVSYRGQHIGIVTDVQLTDEGVRATLELEEGTRIPRDTEVVVANLSAVGEQYVDFRPRRDAGPFLTDGASITLDRSSLPTPTWQVLRHTQQMLRRIDTADLRTIAREVNTIFGGGEVDLPGLATEMERTLGMLQRVTPTALSLVRLAEKPLATWHDLDPELRGFASDARSVTAQLQRSNRTIASLIDQGATLIPVVVEDFRSVEPVLVRLLDDGTPVAAMARRHLPGLLHWYAWGPRQLVAMAESTRDGSGHVILVVTSADNCHYGPEVSPHQRDVPLPLAARCTTEAPHIQQRGSQNVPRP